MIRRAGCAEFAELRSAYVDGALADRHRERLLTHLVGCAACRTDVEDLRRVQSLLAVPREEHGAPQDLSSRLISIAAEDRAGQRRWAAAVDPSRRRRRRTAKVAVATAAAMSVGLAVFGGVGYLAAPPVIPGPVTDPSAEAVSEYGGMLASLPLTTQAVDAVAAIQPTRLHIIPAARSVTPSGVARQLSAEQARSRLERAARSSSRVSFSGRQTYQAVRGDQLVSATVEVVNVAGQGTQLLVRNSAGREVSSRFVGVTHASRLTELSLISLLAKRYTLTGWLGSQVAGRPATVIEARNPAAPNEPAAARWWVDDGTGLLAVA